MDRQQIEALRVGETVSLPAETPNSIMTPQPRIEMTIRDARPEDYPEIRLVYDVVARNPGGLARADNEISSAYIQGFMQSSKDHGIELVAEANGQIVGELHAFKLGLSVFDHVLGNLTVAVHPAFQGLGIGRKLFLRLFDSIGDRFPEISRVELIVRESNTRAIHLYESLGFAIEGRMKGRICGISGAYEADIPMAWLRTQNHPLR